MSEIRLTRPQTEMDEMNTGGQTPVQDGKSQVRNSIPEPYSITARSGDLVIDAAVTLSDSSISRNRFLISSQVLTTTSRVFDSMFGRDSHFSEKDLLLKRAPGSDPPELVLEDDPTTLSLVFKVLHHVNQDIPKTITYEEMISLDIVADKYELTQALMLWLDIWFKGFKLKERLKPGFEDWILVCWVFKLDGSKRWLRSFFSERT